MEISKELLKEKLSDLVDQLGTRRDLAVNEAIQHFENIVQHHDMDQSEEEAEEENTKVIDCVVDFLFSDTYWLGNSISEKSLGMITDFVKENNEE
jgi:hypothetical protein